MLEEHDCLLLLEVAERSIRHGLERDRSLPIVIEEYPETLHPLRATFVTLNFHGSLRGCIGCLEPCRPLVTDVAGNAFSAAFNDPRFPPLTPSELPGLEIHISVLSPSEPLLFASEQELLAQLKPGVDGLILEARGRRGTFLPTVWEQLPDPRDFLRHLRIKAGLPPHYWSPELRVSRYTTECFGRRVATAPV